MQVALVAHDSEKTTLISFVNKHLDAFKRHDLVGTGTTGKVIQEATGLAVKRLMSGPLGGDQQMGSEVAEGNVDVLFFFRDPLTAHPHEPDVSALLRLCDVQEIPIATNRATAAALVHLLETPAVSTDEAQAPNEGETEND